MNRRLAILLVVAFVAVDIALIFGMLRHVNQKPADTDLPATAVTQPTSTPTAPTTSGTPSSTQKQFSFLPADAVDLSIAGDGTIIRSIRGRCDDDASAATVVVSTDGGKTSRTAKTGLQEVLVVKAVSKDDLQVVGAGSDCIVLQRSSTDGGATWVSAKEVTLWRPSLKELTRVVSPQGSTEPGCEVSSLSQVTAESARVSCTDGRFFGTGDSGATWVELGSLPNVRTATFPAPSLGYALATYQGCAAQSFSTRDGGRTWTPGGCITGEPAGAIAATDTTVGAVVDGQFYASSDRGVSFSQP